MMIILSLCQLQRLLKSLVRLTRVAQNALNEAAKTIREIHGIEIKDMTATIDQSTGKITQYRTAVKLSFGVEHSK